MVEIASAEQRQGLAVDLEDANALRALAHAVWIGGEECPDVGYTDPAPLFEQRPNRAVVLDPQRDRREIEHLGFVIWIRRWSQHGDLAKGRGLIRYPVRRDSLRCSSFYTDSCAPSRPFTSTSKAWARSSFMKIVSHLPFFDI